MLEVAHEKPRNYESMNATPTEPCFSNPTRKTEDSSHSLIGRLRNSELLRSYREIFENSSGLSLSLRSTNLRNLNDGDGDTGGNQFCRMLNGGAEKCLQCVETHDCLASGESRGVKSIRCFANMVETAVPIMQGGQVIAQLVTGHVHHDKPTKNHFVKAMKALGKNAGDDEGLEQAYLESPVIGEERYRAMVTLLAAFSLQLGDLAEQIILELRHEKSDCIACAKDFIDEHIQDSIVLDEVASEIHMSRFYLCRKFKESMGMTLTEYVCVRRIEMAKDMLENTSLRVADIAFEVGFQSLSQFNRSFQKFVRITPTEFRKNGNGHRSLVSF